jgi:hypothetical protein
MHGSQPHAASRSATAQALRMDDLLPSFFLGAAGLASPDAAESELLARGRALLADAAPQSSGVASYHLAVLSLDPEAVRELAGHVIESLRQAQDLTEQVRHREDAEAAAFNREFHAAITTAAVQLSPQYFGFGAVANVTPPSRAHVVHRGVELVAAEAARVAELVEAARRIADLAAPEGDETCQPAGEHGIQAAIAEFERFTSRPIDAEFLARALQARGVWLELTHARTNAQNAAQHLERARKQGSELGTTADAGPKWNDAAAAGALSYSLDDWAVSEAEGMRVIEMLRAADPQARAGLVKLLHRRDLLHRLADNVGWAHIKQLAESINDDEAETLLAPYWRGKGETPSLGQVLRGSAAEHRRDGGAWGHIAAFGLDTLDGFLDLATFGGKASVDAAHEAQNAGRVSSDSAGTQASLGIARAALVGGATMAAGGAAGAWAEGAALAAGAGKGGAAAVGATTAGATGSVGGHFAGDVMDQTFLDKDGFDSLEAYGHSFAVGGLVGAATAPLGLAAARYLPAGMRAMAQQLAARHPELVRFLEASQASGFRATVRVRLTARELLRMLDGGGPTAGGAMAPAVAFASGVSPGALANVPPDAEVWVTARPRSDLAIMQSRVDDDGPLFDIDELEPVAREGQRRSSANLFDEHPPDADYGDDFFATSPEPEPRSRGSEGDHEGAALLTEHGTSVLHANRLGIHRPPRHHLLPQEHIEFFQARGFPGRDIDAFCVEMTTSEHAMIHGRHRNWTNELMKRIRSRERIRGRALSRNEIIDVMREEMLIFDIHESRVISYDK